MKKITDDIAKAFDQCLKAVSIKELSVRTGLQKKTLKRLVGHPGKYTPSDTLRKIYPEIRRYLLLKEAEVDEVRPVRIGTPPRMGHYLDELTSNEKVLLDTFSSLNKVDRKNFVIDFEDAVMKEDIVPCEISELSAEENHMLSLFRAIKAEYQEEFLLSVVECAVEEMKKRRKIF